MGQVLQRGTKILVYMQTARNDRFIRQFQDIHLLQNKFPVPVCLLKCEKFYEDSKVNTENIIHLITESNFSFFINDDKRSKLILIVKTVKNLQSLLADSLLNETTENRKKQKQSVASTKCSLGTRITKQHTNQQKAIRIASQMAINNKYFFGISAAYYSLKSFDVNREKRRAISNIIIYHKVT